MGKPVSTLGSMHVCPMIDPGPKPHVGGPVVSVGQTFVRIMGIPVATVSDKCTCVGPLDTISAGSSVVKINGKAVARMGDSCAHGGKLVQGIPFVKAD